jgi:hypothetical protein
MMVPKLILTHDHTDTILFFVMHSIIVRLIIVIIIMDTLYQPEELNNISLPGNACPSMPGSKSKPAIPKEVLNEITGKLSTKTLFLCIR